MVTKFKAGSFVVLAVQRDDKEAYSFTGAKVGALARVVRHDDDWLQVKWIRGPLCDKQPDGGYRSYCFTPAEGPW